MIAEHLFNKQREDTLLDQLESSNFQADWGTRRTAGNSGAFDPNSYAKGSVWPMGTANAAMVLDESSPLRRAAGLARTDSLGLSRFGGTQV